MWIEYVFVFYLFGVCTSTENLQFEEDRPKVTIFYESLCPDCNSFIKDQVTDAWETFGQAIVLDFVPFGNAEQSYEDGHYVFRCQHGQAECLGNKLQACAIEQACGARGSVACLKEPMTKLLKYIVCVEENIDEQRATHKCASAEGLDPDEIIQCANSLKGDQLLSAYGNRTAEFEPKITWVPTVAINGKRSTEAESDLKQTLCKIKPTLPGCKDMKTVFVVQI